MIKTHERLPSKAKTLSREDMNEQPPPLDPEVEKSEKTKRSTVHNIVITEKVDQENSHNIRSKTFYSKPLLPSNVNPDDLESQSLLNKSYSAIIGGVVAAVFLITGILIIVIVVIVSRKGCCQRSKESSNEWKADVAGTMAI